MSGRVAVAAATTALALVGCGTLFVPNPGDIGSSVTWGQTGDGTTWTVSPWPLDESVAFLCLDEPVGFDPATDAPPASCAPLAATAGGDRLVIEFDAAMADRSFVRDLGKDEPPWFLVAAGRRGLTSFVMRTQVIDSPIPSNPGPS